MISLIGMKVALTNEQRKQIMARAQEYCRNLGLELEQADVPEVLDFDCVVVKPEEGYVYREPWLGRIHNTRKEDRRERCPNGHVCRLGTVGCSEASCPFNYISLQAR